MHRKGQAITSVARYINASRSSQLPFLYQTGTLECHFNPSRNRNAAPSTQRSRRAFCSTREVRAHARRSQLRDAIPFEIPFDTNDSQSHTQSYPFEPEDDLETDAPTSESRVRGSTITATEREIFDRIYKDISQSASTQTEEKESDQEVEKYDDEELARDVEEVFESAIRQLEEREQNSKESELGSNANFLDRPQGALDNIFSTTRYDNQGLKSTDTTSVENSEIKSVEARPTDIYEATRQEHKSHIMAMLEKAQTDIEVWKILEAEVFSLAHILESPSEVEKPLASKRGKRRKSKSSKMKDVVAPSNPPVESAPPSDPQLSILQNNYGTYCLEALRLLRREFPTSPYALQVLPAIKRLGSISYVLGASPSLYNEIIFLKWTRYTDLHGIADLLKEMCNQGVEANEVTLTILKAISSERRAKLAAVRNGAPQPVDNTSFKYELTGAWWTMRAVQEAWNRILPMFRRIKMEHRQRLLELDEESGGEERVIKE